MTCRFFREKQKDLGWKVETNLNPPPPQLQKSGKTSSHTLRLVSWVCGRRTSCRVLSGEARGSRERYEADLLNYAAFQGSVEIF